MDKQIEEIKEAIIQAGYKSYTIFTHNSLSFGSEKKSFTVSVSRGSYTPYNVPSEKFESFEEMYNWAMNLKPVTEILYRKLEL